MDRREKNAEDLEELLRMAFKYLATRLWTCVPCVVTKVNLTEMTVEAKPTISPLVANEDGTLSTMPIPVLPDMPIHFPGGGGMFMEFPIAVGDEGLAIFSSMSIDNWWATGNVGVKESHPGRRNNLSDGFWLPRVWSKAKAKALDANVVRIRNDNNDFYLEMNPSTKALHITAPGGVNINGATISSAGEVTDALGKVLGTHTHGGVQTGSGTSGPPS